MSHSVRRALVDWLKGRLYQLAQNAVEYLGEPQVHAQPGRHLDYRGIRGVDVYGPQGYANSSVADPVLRKIVDEHQSGAGVPNLPLAPVNGGEFSGLNNNVVNHQQGSSLNLKNFVGVQQGAPINQQYVSYNQIAPNRKESSGGDK